MQFDSIVGSSIDFTRRRRQHTDIMYILCVLEVRSKAPLDIVEYDVVDIIPFVLCKITLIAADATWHFGRRCLTLSSDHSV